MLAARHNGTVETARRVILRVSGALAMIVGGFFAVAAAGDLVAGTDDSVVVYAFPSLLCLSEKRRAKDF